MPKKYLTFVFLFCAFWLVFFYLKFPHLVWHSGILLAWFTSKGLVMYKDFLNFYFPLSTFFVLPFYLASNWNLELEPILSLLIALATLFTLFKISGKYPSPLGTALALIFFSLLFYYFTTGVQYTGEAITGLFLTILLYRFLSGSGRIIITGALITTTLLFDQIAATALGVIFIFKIFQIFQKTKIKRITQQLVLLVIGILLPPVLVSLYFLSQHALPDFILNNTTYYFTYLKLAREQVALSALPWNEIVLFYTPTLFAALILATAKNNFTKRNPALLPLFLISTVTIPSVIFSVFHRHHFLYALPVLSLLFGLTFDIISHSKNILLKSSLAILSLFIILQAITLILPWYFQKATSTKQGIVNDITPPDSAFETMVWIRTNTRESNRIMVAGDGLMYFRANRLPASKFFTVLPWHYKPLEQTAPKILAHRPDYWVISESYLQRVSSPDGWNSPEITRFIKSDLNQCYKIAATFPDWEIWQKTCHNSSY